MERMQNQWDESAKTGSGDPADSLLDSLFKDYREATPDPDGSPQFTPGVWARIEAQRASTFWFRRYAEICVALTLALAILVTVVTTQRQPELGFDHYVDVLAAADAARDGMPGDVTATSGEAE